MQVIYTVNNETKLPCWWKISCYTFTGACVAVGQNKAQTDRSVVLCYKSVLIDYELITNNKFSKECRELN